MSLDVYLMQVREVDVYSANVTHNLNRMAEEAGLYKPLWRPEEVGVVFAMDLIPYLESGIRQMKKDPPRFQRFNPSNQWGSYEAFVPWLEQLLAACKENPDAKIRVSR